MQSANYFIRISLALLATYRLAQLVALDDGPAKVFLKLRVSVDPTSSLGELVTCPYCLGVWFALALSLLVLKPSSLGDLVLLVFGLAGGQAYLQGGRA